MHRSTSGMMHGYRWVDSRGCCAGSSNRVRECVPPSVSFTRSPELCLAISLMQGKRILCHHPPFLTWLPGLGWHTAQHDEAFTCNQQFQTRGLSVVLCIDQQGLITAYSCRPVFFGVCFWLQAVSLLQSGDPDLAAKSASARKLGNTRVIGRQDIIYTTEKGTGMGCILHLLTAAIPICVGGICLTVYIPG